MFYINLLYVTSFLAAVSVLAFGLGRRVRHGHGSAGRAIVYGLLTVLLTAALVAIAWGVRDLNNSLHFVGFFMLAIVLGDLPIILIVLLAMAVGALAGWAGWTLGSSKPEATISKRQGTDARN